MSQPSWTWKNDTLPNVQPAGWAKPDTSGSAADCMKAESLASNRPVTPDAQKKWRKLSHNQPGHRVVHPGLSDIPVDVNQRFGRVGDKTTSAKTLLDSGPQSSLRDYMTQQKESVYKPKPLGRCHELDESLPEFVKAGEMAFGVLTEASEPALKVIFPSGTTPEEKPDNIGRSTGRKYDWKAVGINPDETRFGKKANGTEPGIADVLRQVEISASIAPKRVVEARRSKTFELGATKPPSAAIQALPEGFTFGSKPKSTDEWGAARCIQGSYGEEALKGDANLGRCSSKGWAAPPEAQNQIHGVTSVRTDKHVPVGQRSVADTTNYGDDGGAKGALQPSKYEGIGLTDADFGTARGDAELRVIFNAAGWKLDDGQFAELLRQTKNIHGVASIHSVRATYNHLVLGL